MNRSAAMVPDVRNVDGSLWKASYRSGSSAMLALFDANAPQFFLREVEKNPARRWWCWWRPEFVLTGITWEGSDLRSAGFTVITQRSEHEYS